MKWFYFRIIIIIFAFMVGIFSVYFIKDIPLNLFDVHLQLIEKFGLLGKMLTVLFFIIMIIVIPLSAAYTLRSQVKKGFYQGIWVKPGWKTNFINMQDPLHSMHLCGLSFISGGLGRLLSVMLTFGTFDIVGILILSSGIMLIILVRLSEYVNKNKYYR